MSPELVVALGFGGALLVFVVLIGYMIAGYIKEKKKADQDWAEAARAQGLQNRAPGGGPVPDVLPRFALLRTGHSQRSERLAQGRVDGFGVWVFELSCRSNGEVPPVWNRVSAGKGAGWHHRHTVACVTERSLKLPSFLISPDPAFHLRKEMAKQSGVMMRMTEALVNSLMGGVLPPGIPLPDHPELEGYRVTGDDEAAVRQLLSRELVDFLASRHDWILEGQGEWLLVTRRGGLRMNTQRDETWLPPTEMPDLLAGATRAARILQQRA